MDAPSFIDSLANNPDLTAAMSFADLIAYTELIRLLKPTLCRSQASYQLKPPQTLPSNIHDFLMAALGMSDSIAKLAWATLRDLAWSADFKLGEELACRVKHIRLFLDHGPQRSIGMGLPPSPK
jgi:hypothetical protein